MPHADSPAEAPAAQHGESLGARRLIYAAVALITLTIISFAMARVAHLGAAGTPIALIIAAIKATVVAAIFMELLRSGPMARITAMVVLGFIALLCAGVVTDVLLR